jgi:hypothetical protein
MMTPRRRIVERQARSLRLVVGDRRVDAEFGLLSMKPASFARAP